MEAAAPAQSMPAGRPKKYGDENTEPLSFRLPESVLDYLGPTSADRREAAREAVFFEKDLTALLKPLLEELRVWAAREGNSYELDRADVLARLVKLGLHCDTKKSKK